MHTFRYVVSVPRRATTTLLALVLFLLILPVASSEQLTTVGVVDVDQVYSSFFRDSQAVRDLERLRQQYQDEINRELSDLEDLRNRRLEAQQDGNDRRVEELDQEILEMERFLEDLTRRRRQQLETRQQNLLSDDFLRQMQEAIQFVAESEGFTIVLRADAAGLQWWAAEVDISNQVVQRLIQLSDR